MKRTTVMITLIDRKKRMKALLLGPFAIHRTLMRDNTEGLLWTVSHRKTGLACAQHVTYHAGLELIRHLRKMPFRWDRLRKADDMPPDLLAKARNYIDHAHAVSP